MWSILAWIVVVFEHLMHHMTICSAAFWLLLLLLLLLLDIHELYFSLNCRYTLRNAEYRLCLERNLDIHEEDSEKQVQGNSKNNLQGLVLESEETNQSLGKDTEFEKIAEDLSDDINIQGLGEISLEAQQYILHLQSHLSSVKKVCSSNLETPLEYRQYILIFFIYNLILLTF